MEFQFHAVDKLNSRRDQPFVPVSQDLYGIVMIPRDCGSYAMLWDDRTLTFEGRDPNVPATNEDIVFQEEWEICDGSSLYYDSVLCKELLYDDPNLSVNVKDYKKIFKNVENTLKWMKREQQEIPFTYQDPHQNETIVNNVKAIQIARAPTHFSERLNVQAVGPRIRDIPKRKRKGIPLAYCRYQEVRESLIMSPYSQKESHRKRFAEFDEHCNIQGHVKDVGKSGFFHLLECAVVCNLYRFPLVLSEEHAEAHVMEVHKRTDSQFYQYCLRNAYSARGVTMYDFQEEKYIYRASEMFLEFPDPLGGLKVYRMSYLDAEKLYCQLLFERDNPVVSIQGWNNIVNPLSAYRRHKPYRGKQYRQIQNVGVDTRIRLDDLLATVYFLRRFTEQSEVGCVMDLTMYGIEPNPGPCELGMIITVVILALIESFGNSQVSVGSEGEDESEPPL